MYHGPGAARSQARSRKTPSRYATVWFMAASNTTYLFAAWHRAAAALVERQRGREPSPAHALTCALSRDRVRGSERAAVVSRGPQFRDFVLDVRLETHGPSADTSYTIENMGAAFAKANESGKGMAGPPSDAEAHGICLRDDVEMHMHHRLVR